jgi:membrane protein YqaA with SNARE-associated domain
VAGLPTVTSRGRQQAALITLAAVAVVSTFAFFSFPQHRSLVGYFLYVIPSHLLISFLSHEPALFAIAKLYPPSVVATVACLGCSVAIILDYWLIGWFVSRKLVREQFDKSRAYEIAQRIFRKAPFLLIVGSALAPVPFYPVKILAIANDYSIIRFIIALVIGRFPRVVLLAIGGKKVNAPNSLLIWAAVGLGAIALFQIWRVRRKRRNAEAAERAESADNTGSSPERS